MSKIDKGYKTICLDLTNKKFNSIEMQFCISDKETSDFFMKITKDDKEIDLSDCKNELYILKPDGNTTKIDLTQDKEPGLFYCDLKEEAKDIVGKYYCQLKVKDETTTEQIVTPSKFMYEVIDDLIKEVEKEDKVKVWFDEETGDLSISNSSFNEETGDIEIGGDK